MRGRGLAVAVVALAVGLSACGSSSKKSSNSSSSGTSGGATVAPTTVATGGAQGNITVTGGDTFTGALTAENSEECSPSRGASGQFSIMLLYTNASGRRELDLNQASVGTTQLTATTKTPTLRYSEYDEAGGGSSSTYYDWGTSQLAQRGTTGTLKITSPKAGSLNGVMQYAGDESNNHPKNYKSAINIQATWNCP